MAAFRPPTTYTKSPQDAQSAQTLITRCRTRLSPIELTCLGLGLSPHQSPFASKEDKKDLGRLKNEDNIQVGASNSLTVARI